MKKPIKLGSERFLKLQQKWYKKLQKDGRHKDVERYQDFNKLPVSTMPRMHGSFIYDPETGEISDEAEIIPLADTDKAGFWREVGRKAVQMPMPQNKQEQLLYNLVAAFAEHGTFMDAARECNLTRKMAEGRLRKWLKANGLEEFPGMSKYPHEPQPEPGPCRSLSKDEIARLNLKPPRGSK